MQLPMLNVVINRLENMLGTREETLCGVRLYEVGRAPQGILVILDDRC